MNQNHKFQLLLAAALMIIAAVADRECRAETVEYELRISRQRVSVAERSSEGMTINGRIPGPTLRFRQGDSARIRVHNQMQVPTSIHWHGVLVPPGMDGVPYVSFPPIQPGGTFTYAFTLRQSGTYWYHSHSSLQEQSGVYGSIVILPPEPDQTVDGDHVLLFSDWTTEDPHAVLRNLKRGSEWYAIEKGAGQSILGAVRAGKFGRYVARELQRMPAMDISDIAYDYFLANGRPETRIDAKNGQTVRLRLINGSATTYFYLEFAGGPMTIVSADGLPVTPLVQQRFLMAVAETYDILVTVPKHGSYELRATAHDASGYASAWLGSGSRRHAPTVPKPDLYQNAHQGAHGSIWALTPAGTMGFPDDRVASGEFDRPGMAGMQEMTSGQARVGAHDGHPSRSEPEPAKAAPSGTRSHGHEPEDASAAGHGPPRMASKPVLKRGGKSYAGDFRLLAPDISSRRNAALDGGSERPLPPYAGLRALKPTASASHKPVREIRLSLDGDMERYVWMLNNKTLSESDVIQIRAGETVRFIMINRTMMHHPMHLHGHFFRVLNGQGAYAPLKHTVDVAPMSTTVIEFTADEIGDWFFHCHLLYHMKSGMARVIHYDGYQSDPEVKAVQPKLRQDDWYFWAEADAFSHMTEGRVAAASTRNMVSLFWEVGWQRVEETDWEGIFTYDRYVNRFSSFFGGVDFLGDGRPAEKIRGILGLRYLLPLNLGSTLWVDSDGGGRVSVEREFALTPRLAISGELEYDTHSRWEGKAVLSYLLGNRISLAGGWHSEFGWGGGLEVRF